MAKKKTSEEWLEELGIHLSPLTTDDELDVESAEIAAREREILIIAAREREILWKSKPTVHALFDSTFDEHGCFSKKWLD